MTDNEKVMIDRVEQAHARRAETAMAFYERAAWVRMVNVWRAVTGQYGVDSGPARGALLDIVREAWGDPTITLACGPSHTSTPMWRVRRWEHTAMTNVLIYMYETEAAALVAALEAAP